MSALIVIVEIASPDVPEKYTVSNNMFALLDFRVNHQILLMTISTISMRQNCSISFSDAPGGARACSVSLNPPYKYDMWSKHDKSTASSSLREATPRAPPLCTVGMGLRHRMALNKHYSKTNDFMHVTCSTSICFNHYYESALLARPCRYLKISWTLASC